MVDPQQELDTVLAEAVPARAAAAAAVIGVDGEIVARSGVGETVRYADAKGTVASERPRADVNTVYDLASLTKVYTTVAALVMTQQGRMDLDRPVRAWLPEYVDGEVTVRHLLTHTAGLPAGVGLRGTEPDIRRDMLMSTAPEARPGKTHRYSDVSFILLGWALETAADETLDQLMDSLILTPLGLTDTGYGPVTPADRAAATEYKNGVLRQGVVHDETAFLLGGACGHAGLFGTVDDVWRFSEALRTGDLLTPETTRDMLRCHVRADGFGQGLGVRRDDPAVTGSLSGSFGHTGFTGTSLVVDVDRAVSVVLTTNRVHPVRTRAGVNPVRCAIADIAYRAQRRKHAGTS